VLGLGQWLTVASLLLLAGLGAWIYWHRHVDVWLLLGVTGVITDVWAYHLWYDDLVLVLAAVTLFRLALWNSLSPARQTMADVLLGALVLFGLAPGGLYLLPPPLDTAYVVAQTIVRLGVLLFLLDEARRRRTNSALSG
jgi:hypothetical protein